MGWPVIHGIATYYASRVDPGADGRLHMTRSGGPDEYHLNCTDSAYGNAIARLAMDAAYDIATAAGAVPNETLKEISAKLVVNYDAVRDYHPEFASDSDGKPWNLTAYQCLDGTTGCGDQKIKQADTVMMAYPLAYPMNISTMKNDLEIFANATDPLGPAMTWAIHSIIYRDIGDEEQAARYFRMAYIADARPPFYTCKHTALLHNRCFH